MVYFGRPELPSRGRGFSRPFRTRGRGRRPFPHRGQNRGFNRGRGGHQTDEGLRITLRNTGRDHRDEGEFDRRSRSPDRDNYGDYNADYGGEYSNEQAARFDADEMESRRDPEMGSPPRKRQHVHDSDRPGEESLRITVGNDMFEDQFSEKQDQPQDWSQEDRRRDDRWQEERRDGPHYGDRRSEEGGRHSDSYRDAGGSREWEDRKFNEKREDRGRGRGYYGRGYDPNYRGRGREDFREGFRGRGRGSYFRETGERGFHSTFDRGRGRGGFSPHGRRSFDDDYDKDGRRRRSVSRDRRRSRSRDRYSRSPDRRRSRSRSYELKRKNYSPGQSSYSRDRRSSSRGRRSSSRSYSSSSRSSTPRRIPRRRSFSRSRSRTPPRRGFSRPKSMGREFSGDASRGRSPVRKRSPSPPRRGLSRPKSVGRETVLRGGERSPGRDRSPGPPRRSLSRPKSMGREIVGPVPREREGSPRRTPTRSRSLGPSQNRGRSQSRGRDQRSQSRGRDQRSQSRRRSRSGSSSSNSSDSRSRNRQPDLSEQQYEEEMYRRLKSELSSNKDPKEREECIAKHIREMAKLSPVLFRQFMAKNAGNLSAMALAQPGSGEAGAVPAVETADFEGSRPIRSILKRKPGPNSPSPERTPSPPPPEPPSALSQIEKVIQALRRGGTKQEEKKHEKEESTAARTGALRQLSSYMDIEDEEEFLYGDGPKPKLGVVNSAPEPGAPSGPFWAANRFEENPQSGKSDLFGAPPLNQPESSQRSESAPLKHPLELLKELAAPKTDPSPQFAFGTLEDKEKSYEQWRAAVFKKGAPDKPKEPEPPQSADSKDTESAVQLSSTVENILKSIGFNFELSQRMQELARQKKEEEQEAIMINQNASFLGSDSDALAEDLTSVFQKESKPAAPDPRDFIREVEAATKVAREKALKAKELEIRHVWGARNPSIDEDFQRGRDREFASRRDSRGHKEGDKRSEAPKRTRRDSEGAGDLSRFAVSSTAEHSPYDPNIQDYQHSQSRMSESQYSHGAYNYSGYEHFPGSEYADPHQPKPIRPSNLISLSGDSRGPEDASHRRDDRSSRSYTDTRLTDRDRHDKSTEDISYKKAGERILIVKKKDERGRIDSPGSDSSFSRRIVLPPREKAKATRERTPELDSRRDSKRRAASPLSPKRSKHSRRSPSVEDRPSERTVFQRSKSSKRDSSPVREKVVFDSKYKYQVSKEDSKRTDPKRQPESSKESQSRADLMKARIKHELPRSGNKSESIAEEVARATKAAAEKVQILKKKKLLTLERELAALRQQHNELLRKRRRQKDGHKDPLLAENTKLQDEIFAQITAIREGKDIASSSGEPASKEKSKPSGDSASSEKSKLAAKESSTSKKSSSTSSDVAKNTAEKETPKIRYEYFDPGSHWCSKCNIICGHMFDFFKHVESKKHQQKLDPFDRPWLMEAMKKSEKKANLQGPVQAHPIKGLEFMMATAAFYCSLCSVFCGDLSIAESHMKSEEHHEKYKDYLSQHPYYEKRYMLERSAALSMQKQPSPEKADKNSDNEDGKQPESSKKQSEESKTSSKGDQKDSQKDKSDDSWRDKTFKRRSLYSDREENRRRRSSSRERDRHKSSGDSRDRRRSPDNRRDSRERREDSRDHSRRDPKEPEKKNDSNLEQKESPAVGKAEESSKSEATAVSGDQPSAETTAEDKGKQGEETKKQEEKKGEVKEADSKIKEESKPDGESKGEGESKGKIPIKLTGKSGIKPVSSLPPWKVMTRPIPKLTMQKRLLASRPQSATGAYIGPKPAPPNEDPIPLGDFLTVGAKKSQPVPVLPDVKQLPDPVDPKIKKQEAENLEELKMLGIDPKSLVPDVKPKAPPPPSQNLSMPADKVAADSESPKTDVNTLGENEDSSLMSETGQKLSSTDSDPGQEKPKPNTESGSDAVKNVPQNQKSNEGSTSNDNDANKNTEKIQAEELLSSVEKKEGSEVVAPLPPNPPPPKGPPPASDPGSLKSPAVAPSCPASSASHAKTTLLPTPDFSVPPPGFVTPLPALSVPPPGYAPLPVDTSVPPPGFGFSCMPPPPVSVPISAPLPPNPPLPPGPPPKEPPPPPPGVSGIATATKTRVTPVKGGAARVRAKPGSSNNAGATTVKKTAPSAEGGTNASPSKLAESALAESASAPAQNEPSASDAVMPEQSEGDSTAAHLAQVSCEDSSQSVSEVASVVEEITAGTSMAPSVTSASESDESANVTEPVASTADETEATSTDQSQSTSTQASASPKKKPVAVTQRSRATRKTSPAPPVHSEETVESTDGSAAASRRPRTRSQAKPQPQRQTRSRTRQQKVVEEEENVAASDEPAIASSTAQEAESPDAGKASSTSACVLDLTSPPADCSGGSEAGTEVTSSSSTVKAEAIAEASPPPTDSALNLTVSPQERGARQGRTEQMMPEDLSSYAEPQDLSTSSAGRGKGRRPPEMPIDLTMRLTPSQSNSSLSEEVPQLMETEPSTSSQISSSEGLKRVDSLDPQSVKDTLLSSTSNPSANTLSELEVGDEGGELEATPSQTADSPGMGVDPEGELVDFSLAPVDFEELVDMEVEDSSAALPAASEAEEAEDTADSTFTTE